MTHACAPRAWLQVGSVPFAFQFIHLEHVAYFLGSCCGMYSVTGYWDCSKTYYVRSGGDDTAYIRELGLDVKSVDKFIPDNYLLGSHLLSQLSPRLDNLNALNNGHLPEQ